MIFIVYHNICEMRQLMWKSNKNQNAKIVNRKKKKIGQQQQKND